MVAPPGEGRAHEVVGDPRGIDPRGGRPMPDAAADERARAENVVLPLSSRSCGRPAAPWTPRGSAMVSLRSLAALAVVLLAPSFVDAGGARLQERLEGWTTDLDRFLAAV